jgi:hypothetical protein
MSGAALFTRFVFVLLSSASLNARAIPFQQNPAPPTAPKVNPYSARSFKELLGLIEKERCDGGNLKLMVKTAISKAENNSPLLVEAFVEALAKSATEPCARPRHHCLSGIGRTTRYSADSYTDVVLLLDGAAFTRLLELLAFDDPEVRNVATCLLHATLECDELAQREDLLHLVFKKIADTKAPLTIRTPLIGILSRSRYACSVSEVFFTSILESAEQTPQIKTAALNGISHNRKEGIFAKPSTADAIIALLEDQSPDLVQAACYTLSAIEPELLTGATPSLIALLDHSDRDVVLAAIAAFEHLPSTAVSFEEAQRSLVAHLRVEENSGEKALWRKRQYIACALAALARNRILVGPADVASKLEQVLVIGQRHQVNELWLITFESRIQDVREAI